MCSTGPLTVAAVEDCALALSATIAEIGGLYGNTNKYSSSEVVDAFFNALPDMADYCEDTGIKVNGIDPIKLFAFAIPHLRSKNPTANINRYINACVCTILDIAPGSLPDPFIGAVNVCEKFSTKQPPNYLAVYAYLKGLEEALQLCTDD